MTILQVPVPSPLRPLHASKVSTLEELHAPTASRRLFQNPRAAYRRWIMPSILIGAWPAPVQTCDPSPWISEPEVPGSELDTLRAPAGATVGASEHRESH